MTARSYIWPDSPREDPEKRQRLEDLAWVLSTVEGERALARQLSAMGLGRQCAPDELYSVHLAHAMLAEIIEANPKSAANILCNIFGIFKA